MKPMIAIFRFTISNGQSIGPERLQQVWAQACRTPDVSVGRKVGLRSGDRPTYSLYGRQNLANLVEIEQRLRALFEELHIRVALVSVDRL
ncbi:MULTISPECIES: hypothetical protein [unclassified Lysobacter]|uniref:hypothetical protein n=1 Tax=unclassified Lysobacter TaxID=2635362 RepID=UPI001C2359D7|nr:hypothetical protein [Lysobacter sp. MMG2]MBU8974550.1 hypothetical protein [Lysobacter sp. MMG2]